MKVAEWTLESWKGERGLYLEEAGKLWGWKLPIEEQIPHLKGIRSFAKLLQGPGKRIVVRFKDDEGAPAYYHPEHRVVAICYGGKWREPIERFEWWAEAMVAHEIGHVRFTPSDWEVFPVWNLIEDRRIEESMASILPKLRAGFEKVARWAVDNLYSISIGSGEELAYPACVAFHWWGAEPTVESLEEALSKEISVKEVNGYGVEEFLNDLYLLVREAVGLAGKKGGEKLIALYKACKLFQAKYFPVDGGRLSFPSLGELVDEGGKLSPEKLGEVKVPDSAVFGEFGERGKELRPLADDEMSPGEARTERERADMAESFCMGRYNSVEEIERAIGEGWIADSPSVPSISRGVLRKFLSFFPPADRGRRYAEEGTRLDVRRFVRGYEDFFVAPKRAPAPYCIDVVVDGSGSMRCIESLHNEDGEHAYVRKILSLLKEAEKVSNLRFRVMLTVDYSKKPLFIKGDYEGKWSELAFSFYPNGWVENFRSAVPHLRSKVILVITDGCFVERKDVEAIRELAKKKTLIGLYVQGEHGYPYEEVAKYMENFHRFLHLKDENDLWKVGKVLARFIR
ncbi:hypothetical protein Theam_1824 (plasmid) [Thermovibrio ammonificans HB-1]|uniref:VWA domain-containing protein n=1 Tax=Thermovibrio ammonificans (strain DSM 15698 / JCM 12110 / HB-1) TaxID=648996 RepID=E8T6V7_THEA1|nr:hypothetical protein [Thermovibrio ammonificans]ADU97780.1 hypothetical protein Theam_1824 [Thermovibrio ammonificans HB-1]